MKFIPFLKAYFIILAPSSTGSASWLGPIGRTPNPTRLTWIPVRPNVTLSKIKSSLREIVFLIIRQESIGFKRLCLCKMCAKMKEVFKKKDVTK